MPILLVFFLVAACLPIEWEKPDFVPDRETSATLTGLAVLCSLSAAYAVRTWALRRLRADPTRRVEVARGYYRLRRALFFVNLGLVVGSILGLGWGWTVQQVLRIQQAGASTLAPFAELAVPLPYFLIIFGNWLIYYDVEKLFHRLMLGHRPDHEFWSRGGYFLHHLRQLALVVGLPVGLFVTQQSVDRMFPELSRAVWYKLASVAIVPVLILLMPLVIKPLLGLRSLPDGPSRRRLETVARRLGFRYTDLLVWPTRGAAANAMIVGLLSRIRYVIFTDRLLEDLPPDELDAVFGHEIGHARHGHIWLYAAFFILSMAAITFGFILLGQQLDAAGVTLPKAYERWEALPPLVAAAAYLFVVFGFLSRRCERQADVFGCRAVSCANSTCAGHDETTVLPPRGRGLCPTGIRTFVRGLERVDDINGFGTSGQGHRRTLGTVVRAVLGWLRAWQHSTVPLRVAFLVSLAETPARERRFQRNTTALRWGLMLGLAAALLAMGAAIGWSELLRTL